MEGLNKQNLEDLYNAYVQNKSIYKTLVNYGGDVSVVDFAKQRIFYETATKTVPIEAFREGSAPSDGITSKEHFCHIVSDNFDLSSIRHRLYFNIGDGRMDFAQKYLVKSYHEGVPFYFKLDKYKARADGFIIYANDDNLAKVVEIVEQIGQEHPEFTEENFLPMSVVRCGWYGYGAELPSIQTHPLSYNGLYADAVENAIIDTVNDCRSFLKLKPSISPDGSMTVKALQMLAGQLYKVVRHRMAHNYENTPGATFERLQEIKMKEEQGYTEDFERNASTLFVEAVAGKGIIHPIINRRGAIVDNLPAKKPANKDQVVFTAHNRHTDDRIEVTSSDMAKAILASYDIDMTKEEFLGILANNVSKHLKLMGLSSMEIPSVLRAVDESVSSR